MYSIIAGILIFASSIYICIAINNIYKSRCDYLMEIPRFINFCDGEIAFYKLTIEELYQKYSENYPNSLIIKSIISAQDNINFSKEQKIVEQIIEGIKTLDRQSHKAFFHSMTDMVNLEIERAVNEVNVKGKMAKRLSPLLGLGILILLI
ncbi:MAG: hypothetical protein GX242_06510 [Clostridiales bacterium]|nr:hypothetical protein [Clostridiales bacterium]